jgi:hypothetical protein
MPALKGEHGISWFSSKKRILYNWRSDLPALKGWHVHKKMCPEKI